MSTRSMIHISLFVTFLAVCSWISIPTAVPFTLQTFGVFLAVAVLGGKKGTLAICIYLILGAIGVPIYGNGTAGVGILLGNTGGYMIGWIFSGLAMWIMERLFGRGTKALACAMVVGLIVCYVFGTAWFMYVYGSNTGTIGLAAALGWCVLPFIIPDLVKIAMALLVSKRVKSIIKED